MKREDMTFIEAVKFLADRANIDIEDISLGGISQNKKQRLKDICEASAEYFHEQLMRGRGEGPDSARKYLAGRGFGGDVPKKWKLGFAPGHTSLITHLRSLGFQDDEMVTANIAIADKRGGIRDRFFDRVIFPIQDASGSFIAFGGRVIGDGTPKYLNSQETPIFHKSNVLYGLNRAKASMASSGAAIVVEGYTDVISLHEAGIQNAVATLGTALTMQHIRMLSRHASKKIVYLFDGDEAGQRAAERALQFIDYGMTPEAGRSRIEICAVTLPGGLDPAEYVSAKGKEGLDKLLEDAEPLIIYGINRRISKFDLATAEGRSAALVNALAVLAPIKDSILAKDYAAQIASLVHVREQDALNKLASLEKPRNIERGAYGTSAVKETSGIPETELSRLRLEREILGLITQNPIFAVENADALMKIHWHEKEHSSIADALLSALMNDPASSSADMVRAASKVSKHASSILTRVSPSDNSREAFHYILNELQIGDGEEQALRLKSELAKMSDDQASNAFDELIALQSRLTELRSKRRPV